MDNVEKLRVLLQHWIDHNKGHVEEFENWRKLMADENQEKTASHITEAIRQMAMVNAELGKALHQVGGPNAAGDKGHQHGHSHSHDHSHTHDHDHKH